MIFDCCRSRHMARKKTQSTLPSRAKLLTHCGQYEQEVMEDSETGLSTCCGPPVSAERFSGNWRIDAPLLTRALPAGDGCFLCLDLRRVTTCHGPSPSSVSGSGSCGRTVGNRSGTATYSLSPGRQATHQRWPIALPDKPKTVCPESNTGHKQVAEAAGAGW